MSYLRATYLLGKPEDDDTIEQCHLVGTYSTTADTYRRIKERQPEGGRTILLIEPGLVIQNPDPSKSSLAHWAAIEAERMGLLSDPPQWEMGKRALRLDRAYLLDNYLDVFGKVIAAKDFADIAAADLVLFDSYVWTYYRPSVLKVYAWIDQRVAALKRGIGSTIDRVGTNSWGDSVNCPGWWSLHKGESGWTYPVSRYGTGQARLYKMLSLALERLQLGSDFVFQWVPRVEWNNDQAKKHMIAGATCFRALERCIWDWVEQQTDITAVPDLYWMGDRWMDGTALDTSVWPVVEQRLTMPIDSAKITPEEVSITAGEYTYRVLAEGKTMADPLSVERVSALVEA